MQRWIVAMGGGGFSTEPDDTRLDRHVLSLAGRSHPRVCFLSTASGDAASPRLQFHRAFSALDCRPSDLPLFEREVIDLRAHVLEQDVVYVGGGSTANLLAIWRVHGLDAILREAWEQGVVLCGVSAGMNCWFEASVTDSFARSRLAPLRDGLGFLAGSACPHYDGEPQRRPTFHGLVADGSLPAGLAADDGAALVFAGTELHEVVTSRPDAAAYRVAPGDGHVTEDRLAVRYSADTGSAA
jgi:dipeptidase E